MAEYPDFEKTCGYGSVTGSQPRRLESGLTAFQLADGTLDLPLLLCGLIIIVLPALKLYFRERMRVKYPGDITDIKKFAPLKEYRGDIRVVGQFSAKEYVVKLDPPTISGVTQHFSDNLINRPDRAGLTLP